MALTEEEVKALEKEANLARRRNIAAANLADAHGTAGMQRAYNQMRDKSDMAAHERYMARRRAFVERNPLAVPGEERRRLQLQEDRGSLRAHEMAMLDKRNAGNLAVAKENRGAAREQGLDAANAKAQADLELGRINKGLKETELKNQLTMHEQTMANNLELADKKGALDKELETIRVQGALSQTTIKNKHEDSMNQAKHANNLQVAGVNADATVKAAKHKAEEAMALAKYRADQSEIRQTRRWVSERNNDTGRVYKNKSWRDLSPEEQREYAESQGYDLSLIDM